MRKAGRERERKKGASGDIDINHTAVLPSDPVKVHGRVPGKTLVRKEVVCGLRLGGSVGVRWASTKGCGWRKSIWEGYVV